MKGIGISKHIASMQKHYLSNRSQMSLVYRLINHMGCWQNMRRIRKSRATGGVIYEFFECSSNIPSGLSAYKPIETCGPLLLYHNSEDTPFFHEFTGTIEHTHS